MNDSVLLKLENVSYESRKRESLIDISFSLKSGEKIVIFGSEDSGVETICPVIAGLMEEFEGDIIFKGRSIKFMDYLENYVYRKELGYLQRGYGLISNMSVVENVSLPLKYHSKLTSKQIIELVNNYLIDMNLDHCRNLRPVDLTKSEKLKTAFLRAIGLEPDLLLIEHPLEGQSIINVQTFLNSFRKESFSKGKSVVFVTYNPNLFTDFADRFIMLYKGNIVFEGINTDFATSTNEYLIQYKKNTIKGPMKIM